MIWPALVCRAPYVVSGTRTRAGEAIAIKFVDKEPEGEGKPKRAKQFDAPPVAREPDAEALKESVDPGLPHAEPAPNRRRKKQHGE